MLLFLLRHGEAQSDKSIPDQDRALTPTGIASIQRVAEVLRRLDFRLDAIYSSPLLRARQTAELAITSLARQPDVQFTEHLMVGENFQKLFDLLNAHAPSASILLVGHEPYVSQLISTLLVGNLDARVDVKKGSLTCVEVFSPVKPRAGTLKWTLTPEIVGLMAS